MYKVLQGADFKLKLVVAGYKVNKHLHMQCYVLPLHFAYTQLREYYMSAWIRPMLDNCDICCYVNLWLALQQLFLTQAYCKLSDYYNNSQNYIWAYHVSLISW